MTTISKEEYLKLLEDLAKDQYGEEEYPEQDLDIPDESWAPAEPVAKEKIRLQNLHGQIDVTKFRKDKIQEALYKCMNIKVDNFIIRIIKYNGYPDKLGKGINLTMDIEVWEKRHTTPSGNPCNMDFRISWDADNRFANCNWLQYFNNGLSSRAFDVPVEKVVEIVRWMQALKRLGAFL